MIKKNKTQTSSITVVAFLAAVFYASWLLGYILNTKVAIWGTASELAATNQPYRLLFVVGDVTVCALIAVIAIALYRRHQDRADQLIVLMYLLFGMGTLVAALVPLNCSPALNVCNSTDELTRVLMHNVIGILASTSLFIAAYSTSYKLKGQGIYVRYALIVWVLVGVSSIMFGYFDGHTMQTVTSLVQRLFLLINSAIIFLVPRQLLRSTK